MTKLSKSEVLMLNIGSMCTGAKVLGVRFESDSGSLGLLPLSRLWALGPARYMHAQYRLHVQ